MDNPPELLSKARLILADKTTEEKARHERQIRSLETLRFEVQNAITVFLRSGVFKISTAAIEAFDGMNFPLRSGFKDLARQYGRPYVRAETYIARINYNNVQRAVIDLKVPNTKRLQALVSPLLLAAVKVQNLHAALGQSGALFLNETSGTWNFWFMDHQGRELFDSFVDRCSTDPACRIILKL